MLHSQMSSTKSPVEKAQDTKAEEADRCRIAYAAMGGTRKQMTVDLETQRKLAAGEPLPSPKPQCFTREQVKIGLKNFFDSILYLYDRKNQDYAAKDDGLENFRETCQRLNLTMPQVFMNLMEKHILALENDAKRPHLALNEGVEDRLSDIACYCGLFFLALKEEHLNRQRLKNA